MSGVRAERGSCCLGIYLMVLRGAPGADLREGALPEAVPFFVSFADTCICMCGKHDPMIRMPLSAHCLDTAT
jgi:hypothetical protein